MWGLYSVEGFPNKNSPHEVIRSWGQVISLEPRKWFELSNSYRRWYRRDFKDMSGHTDVAFGEDIAKDIANRYKRRGVVALELPALKAEKEAA